MTVIGKIGQLRVPVYLEKIRQTVLIEIRSVGDGKGRRQRRRPGQAARILQNELIRRVVERVDKETTIGPKALGRTVTGFDLKVVPSIVAQVCRLPGSRVGSFGHQTGHLSAGTIKGRQGIDFKIIGQGIAVIIGCVDNHEIKGLRLRFVAGQRLRDGWSARRSIGCMGVKQGRGRNCLSPVFILNNHLPVVIGIIGQSGVHRPVDHTVRPRRNP